MKGNLRSFGYRYLLLITILAFSQRSLSQFNFKYGIIETGFTMAPSNLLGDLGSNPGKGGSLLKDYNINASKLMVGLHLNLFPREWYSVRLAANYGNISADDALIKGKGGEEEVRKARNLNVQSRIYEALAAIEFYPTSLLENDPTEHEGKLRPYILAGIGAFHFNPKGQDQVTGEWVSLRRLHTEGQGFKEYPGRKVYSLKQINIPIGVGLKFFLSENISFSGEMLLRKTFTDYIDDVSTTYIDKDLFYKRLSPQRAVVAARMYDKSVSAANRNSGEMRGNSSNMDSYYTAGLKISFLLGNFEGLKYMRCPKY